jgi:hypothetical protein
MRRLSTSLLLLVAYVAASNGLGAQGFPDRIVRSRFQNFAPVISDSSAARLRALGIVPAAAPAFSRMVAVDSMPARSMCPMPVAEPDATKQYASVPVAPFRSGDRMPTRLSTCSNPLDKQR